MYAASEPRGPQFRESWDQEKYPKTSSRAAGWHPRELSASSHNNSTLFGPHLLYIKKNGMRISGVIDFVNGEMEIIEICKAQKN